MYPQDSVRISPFPGGQGDEHPLPYEDERIAIHRDGKRLTATSRQQEAAVSLRHDQRAILIDIEPLTYRIELARGECLRLVTGDGDDVIQLASGLEHRVLVETGDGDDEIQGTGSMAFIRAGAGDDIVRMRGGSTAVSAGAGDDRVVLAAQDQAVVYGGPGNDLIYAAAKRSALFAGEGTDNLVVADGPALVEALYGQNLVVSGPQPIGIHHRPGTLEVAVTTELRDLGPSPAAPLLPFEVPYVSTAIQVEGAPAYLQDVNANLALLGASVTGSTMLKALDDSGARLTIREARELDNAAFEPGHPGDPAVRSEEQHGDRVLTGVILFNPLAYRFDTPPVIMLYHELCHAWNAVTGTVMGDSEQQVVGLPSGQRFDFDGDPTTPNLDTNPDPFNENALRRELNLPPRLAYP